MSAIGEMLKKHKSEPEVVQVLSCLDGGCNIEANITWMKFCFNKRRDVEECLKIFQGVGNFALGYDQFTR